MLMCICPLDSFFFCNIYDGRRVKSISRNIYIDLFRFVCYFFFYCYTHPYVCYKLFKKFVFASLSIIHSFIHSFTHSLSFFFTRPFISFFSGFSRRIFCIKQNGIFLALEEKIHSSTFISFLIHRPSIFNRNRPLFANLINLCQLDFRFFPPYYRDLLCNDSLAQKNRSSI